MTPTSLDTLDVPCWLCRRPPTWPPGDPPPPDWTRLLDDEGVPAALLCPECAAT